MRKEYKLMLYYLKLLSTLQRLYLVFPVVKLTAISDDPIPKRYSSLFLDPVIIDREEK